MSETTNYVFKTPLPFMSMIAPDGTRYEATAGRIVVSNPDHAKYFKRDYVNDRTGITFDPEDDGTKTEMESVRQKMFEDYVAAQIAEGKLVRNDGGNGHPVLGGIASTDKLIGASEEEVHTAKAVDIAHLKAAKASVDKK